MTRPNRSYLGFAVTHTNDVVTGLTAHVRDPFTGFVHHISGVSERELELRVNSYITDLKLAHEGRRPQ